MKILNLEDIGEVHLIKSTRAKYIHIRVKPFEGVRVSVPVSVSFTTAENFVKQKAGWIKESLSKISKVENKNTLFDENTGYRTVNHLLEIQKHTSEQIKIKLTSNMVRIFYPENKNVYDEDVQEAVREGLERAWKKEAQEYLPGRVSLLAARFGFNYHSVTIKNTRSRWGSCSHDNRINLSLHLMRLPAHLIDYVILHELVHTVEKNHGKKFWALLDHVSGDARGLDKLVNNYRIEIY